MEILVCVKRVPDSAENEISVGPGGADIRREDLVYSVNEWDNYAVEEAIQIVERVGGNVTVVSVGDTEAEEIVRREMAMGANQGLLATDAAFPGSDGLGIATILKAVAQKAKYDLILTGAQADDGAAQVGGMLAALLDWPYASLVNLIKVQGDKSLRIGREIEGGSQEISDIELPCVLSIQTGINEPRYVGIRGIRKVASVEIPVLDGGALGLSPDTVGARGRQGQARGLLRPPDGCGRRDAHGKYRGSRRQAGRSPEGQGRDQVMDAKIFVFVTHTDGKADDSALELVTAAQSLFPGCTPNALVAGSGVDAVCQEVAASFGEVWKFDQAALAYPNAELLRPLLVKVLPAGATLLLAHNTFGLDLGPGLSVKLGVTYVPDVVGVDGLEGTTLKAVRQEYAGQVSAHVHCDIARGAVITVRPGAFKPAEAGAAAGQVVDRSDDAAGLAARRTFVELIQAEAGDVDITREDVLVSVGRGIGDKENIPLVEELAEAMGAALSCSRPIVDAKWLDKSRQVGTSGKTVKPRVYLALGISGSFQHVGGIKGNPFLLAINKNPKAAIFQVATIGVVADLMELRRC